MPQIDIDGTKIDVPDAVAAHLAKAGERLTALEAQAKTAAEESGRVKAAAESEARAKDEAKTRAEMEAAAKKGELDKVMELARAKESKYATATLSRDIRGAIAAHPDVKRTGLDDASRASLTEDLSLLVSQGLTFDLDTGTVRDVNGQAVDLTSRIAAVVAGKPWFAEAKLPGGVGAAAGGVKPPTAGDLKRSAMSAEAKAAFIATHGMPAYQAIPLT